MVFCNVGNWCFRVGSIPVTILILIDGFLQYNAIELGFKIAKSHNPYFNRWFSAIVIGFKEGVSKEESQSLF